MSTLQTGSDLQRKEGKASLVTVQRGVDGRHHFWSSRISWPVRVSVIEKTTTENGEGPPGHMALLPRAHVENGGRGHSRRLESTVSREPVELIKPL